MKLLAEILSSKIRAGILRLWKDPDGWEFTSNHFNAFVGGGVINQYDIDR